jgi:hypothetical protein
MHDKDKQHEGHEHDKGQEKSTAEGMKGERCSCNCEHCKQCEGMQK